MVLIYGESGKLTRFSAADKVRVDPVPGGAGYVSVITTKRGRRIRLAYHRRHQEASTFGFGVGLLLDRCEWGQQGGFWIIDTRPLLARLRQQQRAA